MKYGFLFWANLRRNPTRTILTGICLVIAFLLFGLLQPISKIFREGPEMASVGRLVVTPKHSSSDLLPVRYFDQIQQIEGVTAVAHMSWFGGTYVDPANFFPQFAVTPEEYLQVISEIELPEDQREAFISNRRAAIVGRETADKFGMKVGDRIPLIPNIWHNRDSGPWVFDLVGIFNSSNKSAVNNTGFYFGYGYFDDYRAFGNGTVGSYLVRVSDPTRTAELANEIDARFANSDSETRTLTDREYALSFAKQMGDVGLIVTAILSAVFFTILLLAGNTIAQATRERIPELAVMRVVGFHPSSVLWMVLTESILLSITAAIVGLLAAQLLLVQIGKLIPELNQLGPINVPLDVAGYGLIIALLIGLIAGLPPALKAMRLSIVDALRV